MALVPTYTFQPAAFFARSHPWNRRAITRDSGPTRWQTSPVAYRLEEDGDPVVRLVTETQKAQRGIGIERRHVRCLSPW